MIFQVKHLHLLRQRSSRGKRPHEPRATVLSALLVLALCFTASAQVNTGSTGSDGALDFSAISYTTNVVIDMSDHPTGIYNYTYVNIPANVTVTFVPNANNSPVTWLVQNAVSINGTVNVSGQSGNGTQGGQGGPGGWSGGNGGGVVATSGQGPGGGVGYNNADGASGSYGTAATPTNDGNPAGGSTYGNTFLIPLLGGSGGGGSVSCGGGGGGGAILVATSATFILNGSLGANGGFGQNRPRFAGGGSGGAIRLVASEITGTGAVGAVGGPGSGTSGNGRVRFDTYQNSFSGSISGVFSQGSQFVIIPTAGQLPQLAVTSVAGIPVSGTPTGVLSTPDALISAQQSNPIPIVVCCANIPLNTEITVSVKPANGATVSATGYNTAGTQTSSTATISILVPRGGGLIYATAATSN